MGLVGSVAIGCRKRPRPGCLLAKHCHAWRLQLLAGALASLRLPVHCLAMALPRIATDQFSRQPDLMPSATAQRMVIQFLTFRWRNGKAIRGSRSTALARSVTSMFSILLTRSIVLRRHRCSNARLATFGIDFAEHKGRKVSTNVALSEGVSDVRGISMSKSYLAAPNVNRAA
jgi:hypothetical protein